MLTSHLGATERSSKWNQHVYFFQDRRALDPDEPEKRTINGPPFRSPALAFTPDGSRLVTGMADGSVLVWDLRSTPGR
jgi:WD40 repeat protein